MGDAGGSAKVAVPPATALCCLDPDELAAPPQAARAKAAAVRVEARASRLRWRARHRGMGVEPPRAGRDPTSVGRARQPSHGDTRMPRRLPEAALPQALAAFHKKSSPMAVGYTPVTFFWVALRKS